MIYNIYVAEAARLDLKGSVDYIKFQLNNRQAAVNLMREANEAFHSLAHMPERYRLVGDMVLASWGIRYTQVKNYFVFYTVSPQTATVHIIRFLYAKSDWAFILRNSYLPEA